VGFEGGGLGFRDGGGLCGVCGWMWAMEGGDVCGVCRAFKVDPLETSRVWYNTK
jgi:hypothetical protein